MNADKTAASKSFSADEFTSERFRSTVQTSEMPEYMVKEAIGVATDAIKSFDEGTDIAMYIKREFDKRYGPSWHCVVARDFSSYVTYKQNNFVVFCVGEIGVLLFKT